MRHMAEALVVIVFFFMVWRSACEPTGKFMQDCRETCVRGGVQRANATTGACVCAEAKP